MTATPTAKLRRTAAALLALAGWFALLLQYYLSLMTAGVIGISQSEGIVRFFSGFGVQANILAALVLTVFAIKGSRDEWLVHPFVRSAVAVYNAMAAMLFAVLPRRFGLLGNIGWLVDAMLYLIIPAGYLVFWLACVRKTGLRWYDPLLWLIYPLFYLGFVLVRGKMSGFYPYPFIDAKTLGYAGVAANTAGLLIVCAAIGMCLVLIGWWLARRRPA
jgi:hypothetical protein